MASPAQEGERAAWIQLSLIDGLGAESLRRLLKAFGTPEQVFAAPTSALRGVVKAPVARAIAQGIQEQQVAPTLAWLAHTDHHLVTLADAHYPSALLQTSDPPALLYVIGKVELLQAPSIAIVGSRNATPQGLANAQAFAAALSGVGLTIVSGLAIGIDAAAHAGGLRGSGSSVAIVGTGLDRVYPARNRPLAKQLAAQGALVSEFALGTPALAGNFPRRNRIISGLAKGCLVVEATLSSGSLITARLAAEQGREVFAVPGSIHSPFSKGCHLLLKQGAKLVESAQDILEELQWHTAAAQQLGATVDGVDDALLQQMGFDAVSVDELVTRTGASAEHVMSQLTQLELNGRVAMLAGGRFQRLK